MIKMIFFDIDGTTYQHNIHDNPPSTKYALKQLKEKGFKLAICTSRAYEEMVALPSDFLNLMDAVVCCAGGQIVYHDESKSNFLMNQEEVEAGINYFNLKNIPYRWVTPDGECNLSTHDEDVTNRFHMYYQMIPPIKQYQNESCVHLLYYTNDGEALRDLYQIFTNSFHINYGYTHEVLANNTNKATSMQVVAEHFGYTLNECAAFGDGENDIQMLNVAKIGVAMGNGSEPCKAAADYVTDSIENDGLYHACLKFGWIERGTDNEY